MHTLVERMEAKTADHSASHRTVTATEGCQHELPESAKTDTPVLTLRFCRHVILQALGACVLRGLLFVAMDLRWNAARYASWHILQGLIKLVKPF